MKSGVAIVSEEQWWPTKTSKCVIAKCSTKLSAQKWTAEGSWYTKVHEPLRGSLWIKAFILKMIKVKEMCAIRKKSKHLITTARSKVNEPTQSSKQYKERIACPKTLVQGHEYPYEHTPKGLEVVWVPLPCCSTDEIKQNTTRSTVRPTSTSSPAGWTTYSRASSRSIVGVESEGSMRIMRYMI